MLTFFYIFFLPLLEFNYDFLSCCHVYGSSMFCNWALETRIENDVPGKHFGSTAVVLVCAI